MEDVKMPHWSKYKNKMASQVPKGYLLWLYNDWGLKNSGELHRELREYIEKKILPSPPQTIKQ